jgi:hypothetical protein
LREEVMWRRIFSCGGGMKYSCAVMGKGKRSGVAYFA